MKTDRELIEESKSFLALSEVVQDEAKSIEERADILNSLSESYHTWYHSALALFDMSNQAGERQKFEQEYIGTFWSPKILKFLTSGLQISPLYLPDKPTFSKWVYLSARCFKEPLFKQCNILANLKNVAPGSNEVTEPNQWNTTIRRIFRVFVDKAESAETNHEKKLTYEYLAIFIIGSIDGLTIIGHDERGATGEIDIWVANESPDSFWQKMGALFIVECKNWSDPVGVQEIRNLRTVMNDKNVSLAILVSKNGTTGETGREAVGVIQNAFRAGKHIVVLEHSDLLDIANGIQPADKIKRKLYELYVKS